MRALLPVIAALAAVTAAVTAQAAPAPPSPLAIAVVPLRPATATSPAWMGVALQESMTTDLWYLEGFYARTLGHLVLVTKLSPAELGAAPRAGLDRAARPLGLRAAVLGNYRLDGATLEVTVELLDLRQGRVTGRATARGPAAELTDVAARLALEIAARAGVAVDPAARARVLRPKTRSLAALEAHAAGYDHRVLHYRGGEVGRRERALVELQRATTADPGYAEALNTLGWALRALGRNDEALRAFRRALVLRPDLVDAHMGAASCHLDGRRPAAAAAAASAGVALNRSLGDHVDTLAAALEDAGDARGTEQAWRLAVRAKQAALGPDHLDLGASLMRLAGRLHQRGEQREAEQVLRRALGVLERGLGPGDPQVAQALTALAVVVGERGQLAVAEELNRRALGVYERAHGPKHPHVALSLNNLGWVLYRKGEYHLAEPILQRALDIYVATLGAGQHEAPVLNHLALVAIARGQFRRAERLYQRALAITERQLGPRHPRVALLLHNLADLYRMGGDLRRAEPMLRRALESWEKSVGPDHPDVAGALRNLGRLYHAQGDLDRAEQHYRRALAANERTLGPDHPDVAGGLNDLAFLLEWRGRPAEATRLYERSLAMVERSLGPRHPRAATVQSNLALLHWASGDLARAVTHAERMEEIQERGLALLLSSGTEEARQAYLASVAGHDHAIITLHVQGAPRDPRAARLALTTILRRKGRVLDALSDSLAALRGRLGAADRRLLEDLGAARARLAERVLGGQGRSSAGEHAVAVEGLEREVRQLEAALGTRSAEFRAGSQEVTVARVQAALPPGAALVELAIYRPFRLGWRTEAQRLGPPRYVAYVLRREGPPAWVELGDAAPIDAAVGKLRQALASPARTDTRALGATLHRLVMAPLRPLLEGAAHVFIAPDRALNLLAFPALVDEQGRYLVERASVSFLSSGRDLVRLQVPAAPRQRALVVADPAFDPDDRAALAGAEPGAGTRSADFARLRFAALPGTAGEARAVASLLGSPTVLTGARATEGALKGTRGPSVLHVATHGFFLEDLERPVAEERLASTNSAGRPPRLENPLLRSGLVLAGANRRRSGIDDGVLTALEAASLDLWGTGLVVLSACETGVGEVRQGDGVHGLRRALVLAGSRSQVMSLWKVDDETTRELMESFYRGLRAGQGRGDALRSAQRAMLARPGRGHPYYWGAFILSGDQRPLAAAPAR